MSETLAKLKNAHQERIRVAEARVDHAIEEYVCVPTYHHSEIVFSEMDQLVRAKLVQEELKDRFWRSGSKHEFSIGHVDEYRPIEIGEAIPDHAEVSFDGGVNWRRVDHGDDVLTDKAVGMYRLKRG